MSSLATQSGWSISLSCFSLSNTSSDECRFRRLAALLRLQPSLYLGGGGGGGGVISDIKFKPNESAFTGTGGGVVFPFFILSIMSSPSSLPGQSSGHFGGGGGGVPLDQLRVNDPDLFKIGGGAGF